MGEQTVKDQTAALGGGGALPPQALDGGDRLVDLLLGMGGEADAVHARIQSNVTLHRDPRFFRAGQQAAGVLLREEGGGDVVGGEDGGVLGVGVAQHQNVGVKVRGGPRQKLAEESAEGHRFLGTGYGEGAAPRLQEGGHHGTDAVAVGVGLHHGDGVGAGGDGLYGAQQGVIVLGQGFGVNDRPGAGMG